MFRRDPQLARWLNLCAALGHSERAGLAWWPLARQTFRRGGVIGAAQGGRREMLAFGGVEAVMPFELASVTKPFTAALADALVRAGRLGWERPLAELGGPLRRLPRFLTPLALATHTAGLPTHPARVALTTFTRFSDPYGSLTPEGVIASARRWARPPRPVRFLYSNLGVGTLALALASAAGEELSAAGYGRALERWVTGPLGVPGVTLTPPTGVARPYGVLGGPEVTRFAELAGAGGLFGRAHELLAFAGAHLDGRAGTHWQRAVRAPGLTPPHEAAAPGWFHSRGVVWHDGVARGTRTALGFHPESGAAVTLLVRGGVPVIGGRGEVPLLLLALLGGLPPSEPHS